MIITIRRKNEKRRYKNETIWPYWYNKGFRIRGKRHKKRSWKRLMVRKSTTRSGEQSAMSKFKDWVMEIYEELEDHE